MPPRLRPNTFSHTLRTLSRPQTYRTDVQPSHNIIKRKASTYPSAPRRFISTTIFLATTGALVAYYYDSRSVMHEHVVMPVMRLFDPETGHKLAIRMLSSSSWFRPRDRGIDGVELEAELFGMKLSNPVGMAAGFDKDANAIDGLFDLGFGYVEVGSVTPEPQPGNPTPRFFRLPEDSAAINRYGFNSLGHGHTLSKLKSRLIKFSQSHPEYFPSPLPLSPLPPKDLPRSLRPGHILAVNLGKNKSSAADSNDDYIRGVRMLGPYADVVVINVSSPNTPGLRALQGREILTKLLQDVVGERNRIKSLEGLPKIAVKVACDLSEEELGDVASAVRASGVEGVIVSNTTIRRNELALQSANADQIGGLSGRPLFPYALNALKTLRPLLPPSIPIIGCGGIWSANEAIQMANAGASMIQLYTSFGYRGVGTPRLLKDEISQTLFNQPTNTTWKSQIGKDYSGGEMGWDETRLKAESEALQREAKDLGEILRKAWEEDDTAKLIAAAEEALRGVGSGSRDNLMGGGEGASEEKKNEVRDQVAEYLTAGRPDTGEAAVGRGMMIEAIPGVAAQEVELNDLRGEVVTGEANPLPVIVEVSTSPGREDEFTSAVRSGQRRLV